MIRRVLAIAALLLLVPATAAYAQYNPGQPGFIITPSTTTAGAQVSFVGEGCPANSTVTFTSNGVTLGSGSVHPGDLYAALPGADHALALIERLTQTRAPVVRPSSPIPFGTMSPQPLRRHPQ